MDIAISAKGRAISSYRIPTAEFFAVVLFIRGRISDLSRNFPGRWAWGLFKQKHFSACASIHNQRSCPYRVLQCSPLHLGGYQISDWWAEKSVKIFISMF
jgi:hypothetical protein